MISVELKTAQNVGIAYELASLRERILAFLIDAIGILSFSAIFVMLFAMSLGEEFSEAFMAQYVLIKVVPIMIMIFYHFLSETLMQGQSIGKKMMGLKVSRVDGRSANLSDYLIRAVLLMVDVVLSGGVISILMIITSSNRQRLGDFAANTVVIRVENILQFHLADIVKIETLENYDPIYPEVRQFSEEDMLFIKSFIERYRKYPNEAHQKAMGQLIQKLKTKIGIEEKIPDDIDFLKTLIKDYIVLTR